VAKLSAGACHFIAAVSQETKTLTLGSTQGIKTWQVVQNDRIIDFYSYGKGKIKDVVL
jgi:hypothetical protein